MSNVSYNELSKKIENKELNNIYFIMGDEYLVGDFKNKIFNIVTKGIKNDFNFFYFTDSNIDIDLFDECVNTFPLNSESKCIILQDINFDEIGSEKLNQFISILSNIPEFTIVIICNCLKSQKSINLSKIKKTVSKFGIVADLNSKDIDLRKQIVTWIECDFGKKISNSLLQKIYDNLRNISISEIRNEIKKMCEFEKSDTITMETFNKVCTSRNDKIKIFDLPREILKGNVIGATLLLKKLLLQGEEPVFIISVISTEYIDILRVKLFDKYNIGLSKLTEIFDYKSKEFRIANAQRKSAVLDAKSVMKSIKLLLISDMKLKATSESAEIILMELVTNLCKLTL